MGYTCPVCKKKYKTSQDCGNCGFPTPPRLFLSESHAKNWFNAEVLPRRTAWETKFRISKLEELVESKDDETRKLRAELQEFKNQNSKHKGLVKSHEDEIQRLKDENERLNKPIIPIPLILPEKITSKETDTQPRISIPQRALFTLLILLLVGFVSLLTYKGTRIFLSPTSNIVGLPSPHTGSSTINVGDIIPFSKYSWRVLDIQDGKALILSERVIEKRLYHSSWAAVTWETCTLRQYLNGEFYNSFSTEEKARIAETRIPNNNNPWYGTNGGNVTNDRIFLLSIEEVVKYFGDSGQLRNRPSNSAYINDKYNSARIAQDGNGGASWWWLRSPGINSFYAASVDSDGSIYINRVNVVYGGGGIRPALWLNL